MLKKILGVILTCLLAFPLAACSATSSEAKTVVRIALCQRDMQEGVPQLMREKFPDVSFEFTLAVNSADYYEYLNEHGDLPDILTVRRFSLRDSLQLKDALVDVSQTDFAANYYQNYLQNYTYEDGTVNWLPSTAEMYSVLANKTLFEENGIEIPTDYASFAEACKQFQEKGIVGFYTDWNYDYTSLETLEGFNADALQTLDGKRWRSQYESGSTDTLDSTVWPEAFKTFEQFLQDTYSTTSTSLKGEDIVKTGSTKVSDAFKAGECAMMRGSGSDLVGYNSADNGYEYIMLPQFGTTSDQNWVLTYPYFQAAMNKNSSVDSALLQEIYEYLLGQECSDALGLETNVLSYTSAVKVSTDESLSEVAKYITDNKIFTRIANNDFFTASKKAVQGMQTGEYTAEQAYDVFNETLKASENKETTYDLNFEKSYEYAFDKQHGSQSSSAILNTARSVWGSDLAVSYATVMSNSIYEGKAASSELTYFLATGWGRNYVMDVTGAQVKEIVSKMLNYDTNDKIEGSLPVSDDMLPVSSGFEMTVTKKDGKYSLDGITIDGKAIDESKTYSLVVTMPDASAAKEIFKQAGLADDAYKANPDGFLTFPKALAEYFKDTSAQWVEPTDYITLKNA